MGCDIHLYQEKKVNGKWVAADAWRRNEYDDEGQTSVGYDDRLYTGRNYRLFFVLANVRNGYGFAGIVTGDPVIPIAMPRGLPNDCCPEIQRESDGWGVDGHSHTWLTLDDIMGYPWRSVRKQGMVPLDVYKRWKDSEEANPETWCGDVSGPGIEKISEELAMAIDMTKMPKREGPLGERIYVIASWSTSLRDDCESFLEVAIPRLQELEAECGVGNARLVFWFDN